MPAIPINLTTLTKLTTISRVVEWGGGGLPTLAGKSIGIVFSKVALVSTFGALLTCCLIGTARARVLCGVYTMNACTYLSMQLVHCALTYILYHAVR